MRTLSCILMAYVFSASSVIAQPNEQPRPDQIDLTPDARFTVFEGPLLDNGRIDYITALNRHFSRGVTKENNAFRALFLIMPRNHRPGDPFKQFERQAQITDALRITEQELENAPTFVPWYDYATEQGLDQDQRWDIRDAVEQGTFNHEQIEVFVQWLQSQEPVLVRVIETVKLDGYWRPIGEDPQFPESGLVSGLGGLGELRSYARALESRASWAMHKGDQDKVVESLVAIRWLAYQVSRGHSLIDSLVAISIDALGVDLCHHVIKQRKLDKTHIEQLARGLAAVPESVPVADTMAFGTRASHINAFVYVMTSGMRFDEAFPMSFDTEQLEQAIHETGIDLDAGVRRLNAYLLGQAAEARVPTYAAHQRLRELRDPVVYEPIQAAYDEYVIEDEDADEQWIEIDAKDFDKDSLTKLTADLFYRELAVGSGAARTMFRLRAQQQVMTAALACERYRHDQGEYPNSLQQLMPDYLPEVPIDPMDGEPLRYRRAVEDTAVIYSISTDLEDDGGATDANDYEATKEGDYVWRLELPKD